MITITRFLKSAVKSMCHLKYSDSAARRYPLHFLKLLHMFEVFRLSKAYQRLRYHIMLFKQLSLIFNSS